MRHALASLAAALALLSGCGGGDPSPWEPVTTPFDPTCSRCVELGSGSAGHGVEVLVVDDPQVDDELAQWGRCVEGWLDCLFEGGVEDECMRAAPCPSRCRDAYEQRVAGVAGVNDRYDAFKAVFFEPSGLCYVEDGPEVRP